MKSYRLFGAALAGLTAVTLVAGCSSSSSSSASTTGGSGATAADLTFWSWVPNMDKIVDVWNSSHPGIHVTFSKQAGGDAEAQKVLAGLGVNNVTVKAGATADGDDANAPFDVIFLCGATEIAPERLYGQLAEGGRLVGISAAANPPRAVLVTRSSHDFGSRPLFDATAPVLPGLARTPGFVF